MLINHAWMPQISVFFCLSTSRAVCCRVMDWKKGLELASNYWMKRPRKALNFFLSVWRRNQAVLLLLSVRWKCHVCVCACVWLVYKVCMCVCGWCTRCMNVCVCMCVVGVQGVWMCVCMCVVGVQGMYVCVWLVYKVCVCVGMCVFSVQGMYVCVWLVYKVWQSVPWMTVYTSDVITVNEPIPARRHHINSSCVGQCCSGCCSFLRRYASTPIGRRH